MPGRGAVFALAGFAALLAVVAISSVWSGASQLTRERDPATDAERAVRAFVAAFGTFDASTSADYHARLVSLTADPLRAELRASAVDPAATAEGRTVRTDVQSVSPVSESPDAARFEVMALQERRWTDPAVPVRVETVRQRIELGLVHEDGRWLVNDVLLLAEEHAGG